MASLAVACHIRHVSDVLIWFRRPVSAAGGHQRATTSDREARSAESGNPRRDGGSVGGADRSAQTQGSPGEDVRLLRLRRKVLSPR
jgi:hypothetical protein